MRTNKCNNYVIKIKCLTICLFIFIAYNSLGQNTNYGEPVKKPSSILYSPESLDNYLDSVDLSHDFTGLDTAGNIISKEDFLKLLSSGEYIPLKLISKHTSGYYRLYKCPPFSNKDLRNLLLNIFIKNYGATAYNKYKMIGAPFPVFNFKDLDGHDYNNTNTKGKIVVLKCWFIQCKPCVQEMPELDKIVKQYEDRKDIVFISLSFDSNEELRKFLLNTPFKYAVIPDQRYFLDEILKVTSYPTHIIVNKKGNVAMMSNDYEEMASVLKKEAYK